MEQRAWVATRKGLFELRQRDGAWAIERVSFLGEPVSMLLPPQGAGRMFAALNLGHFGVKLHASDDAGVTWHELPAPAYPSQPEGEPVAGVAWKLVQIWSMERAGDTLWAGTLPGGLFRSTDAGESWQLNEPLWSQPGRAEWFGGGYDVPGIHSICPHSTRPGELLVGISCGGAWVSRDAGTSWKLQADGMRAAYMPPEQADSPNTQDPHRIVRCAAQPEVLWCQHHNGIWRSGDNAASWQEITTAPLANFGFGVAVHPDDADTAWFVPGVADQQRIPVDGALVVNRTRDGGRSFETLRAGLPQQDCYDLVYRHGLAVDASGARLLMASTTGNLWASDDGGNRWAMVQAHLPPIYAVRFG
ncbi:MAG: exo-alpha-sialidase [Pseudomonadota bacterium]